MGTSFYPGKDETYDLIRKGYFMPPEYYGTNDEDIINLDFENSIAFVYSEFACIVDYLIQKYGLEKFLAYMKALIDYPGNGRIFKEFYNRDFGKFISEFREYVNNSSD
jgi:GR25 family glycosyltransferase involved in LPS biosynthesis